MAATKSAKKKTAAKKVLTKKVAPKRKRLTRAERAAQEQAVELGRLREIREANERRVRERSTTMVDHEIPTRDGSFTVRTGDGLVYVDDHVLDRDQLVNLQQKLASAFQAVS